MNAHASNAASAPPKVHSLSSTPTRHRTPRAQTHCHAQRITSHPRSTTCISATSTFSNKESPELDWHSPPPPPPFLGEPSRHHSRQFSQRADSVWSQNNKTPRERSRPIDVHRMLKGMAIEGLLCHENTSAISDDPLDSPDSSYRLHYGERHLERKSQDCFSQAYDRGLLSKIGGLTRSRSSVSSVGSAQSASPPLLSMSSPDLETRLTSAHRPVHHRNPSIDSITTTRETAGKALAASQTYGETASSSPPEFHQRLQTPEADRPTRQQSADSLGGPAERRTGSPNMQARSPPYSQSRPPTVYAGTKRRASSSYEVDTRHNMHGPGPDRSSPHVTQDSLNGQPISFDISEQYSAYGAHTSRSSAAQDMDIENVHDSTQKTPMDAQLWQTIQSAPHPGSVHTLGTFVCDCCPKKPRRFANIEDLRLHHLEKQYTCAYCPNRFKNKNEAERHQNSLHLRKHSWSCSAMRSREEVFHSSQTNAGATDICGFCGDEFSNPANWQQRSEHIEVKHKFGDCNQSKKFFRADHFRQHLKHSHAGTSGKWTNMIENACIKDEPEPVPIDRSQIDQLGSMQSGQTLQHHLRQSIQQQQPMQRAVSSPVSQAQAAQQEVVQRQQQAQEIRHIHVDHEPQLQSPSAQIAADFSAAEALMLDPRMTSATYEHHP